MKSFFNYYGSKNQGARHYGPPRRDLVIEPFAGSAAYSVKWECPNVLLYDLSDDVCAAWDWLINCSEEDVRKLPIRFKTNEEMNSLPDGPRQVVYWSFWFGECAIGNRLPKWNDAWAREGKLTGHLANVMGPLNRGLSSNMWDERRRDRVIRQKPLIRNWTIECLDYRNIPLRDAHWHVDPPYQCNAGRKYPHNEIDFDHLGKWCRELPGAVDVCEQEGADWLPFKRLYSMRTTAPGTSKKSSEVVWRKDSGDLFG